MMFLSRTPRPSSEPSKKEMLPPTPVPSSSSSSQKPAQKRPRREAHPGSQDPPRSASSTKGNHKDSPVPKRRKAEGKGSGSSTEHKVSGGAPMDKMGCVGLSLHSIPKLETFLMMVLQSYSSLLITE